MRYVMILSVVFLAGCGSVTELDNEGQRLRPLVEIIVQRHDVYATQTTQGTVQVAESAALLALFSLESIPVVDAKARFDPVATRHDEWVRSDLNLSDVERRLALFSTENVRRTIAEAKTE